MVKREKVEEWKVWNFKEKSNLNLNKLVELEILNIVVEMEENRHCLIIDWLDCTDEICW